MQKIKILNKRGIASCQMASSKDSSRKSIFGIIIYPDGTAVGTSGVCLVICKNAVEKYDGEPIRFKGKQITASMYNNYKDAFIVISEDFSFMQFSLKDSFHYVSIKKLDDKYVDWKEFADNRANTKDSNGCIAFNSLILSGVSKIASLCGFAYMEMGESNDPIHIVFDTTDDNPYGSIKMILMPVRA